MPNENPNLTIVMADDDEDDRIFAKDAFEANHLDVDMRFVEDGEQLMDYLYHRGDYSDPESSPRPGLILLDLNMPRKDGREALKEIKTDRTLCTIPVVVLTTSSAEEDIIHTYQLGVNSFITKPVTFPGLVEVIRQMEDYWFQLVKLPKAKVDA